MSFKTPLVEDNVIWDVFQSQHILPTVTVALELGLFDLLEKGPLSRDQVAENLKIGLRSAAAVLAVLGGLKLVQRNGAAYSLTNKSKNFLVRSSEFSWANMLVGDSSQELHKRMLKVVKEDKNWEGGAAKEWEMGELSSKRAEELTDQMHSHSFPSALGAARAYDWSKTKKFLDVAGGSGCFAIALALELGDKIEQCTVAELSQVTPFTQKYIKKYNLESKITTHNLNMFKESFPTSYDTHFYSNIFHDWSFETNVELAKKSFASLPSGGRILVHEMVMKDTEDGDLTTACFSVHMLIYTKGKQYSFLELKILLESVGFEHISVTPTYGYYSIVTGIKP